jgi:hypothetical protein
MTDLPPVPEDFDADALTPEAFLERPTADAGDLTLDSISVVRGWLNYLRTSPTSPIVIVPLENDEIDIAIASLAGDYRKQGVDLYDKRDLLSAYWTHQTCIVALLGDLAECGGDPYDVMHSYIHISRAMANIALSFELLVLDVFGEEAALPE